MTLPEPLKLEETPDETLPTLSRTKRMVYSVLGGFFVLLAALGAILPVLPATPFLLISTYFFARSYPKFNRRLFRSKLFGPILSDWTIHRGVRPLVKLKAIVLVVIIVCLSLYIMNTSLILKFAVASLALLGIIVVLCLPTVRSTPSSD